MSPFHLLHGIAIASFWIAPILWDLLPVRLTLGDFRAPGWGEPWFPLSVALIPLLTEFMNGGFCVVLPALFCLVWPPFQSLGWYHGWYNAITFLSVTDVANWPADHPAISGLSFVFGWLFCVGFWFLCFLVLVLVVFSLLASGQLTGLCTGPTSVQLLKPTFVKLMTSLR